MVAEWKMRRKMPEWKPELQEKEQGLAVAVFVIVLLTVSLPYLLVSL